MSNNSNGTYGSVAATEPTEEEVEQVLEGAAWYAVLLSIFAFPFALLISLVTTPFVWICSCFTLNPCALFIVQFASAQVSCGLVVTTTLLFLLFILLGIVDAIVWVLLLPVRALRCCFSSNKASSDKHIV